VKLSGGKKFKRKKEIGKYVKIGGGRGKKFKSK
jgi:hypothetical protein